MAIPAFRAVGSLATTVTGDLTVTLPPHEAGDIIRLDVCVSATADAPTVPVAWTEFPDSPQTLQSGTVADSIQMSSWWLRATSSSETDPNVTGAGSMFGVAASYSGCITTGNPYDVTVGDTETGTSLTIPGDTTTVADCLIAITVGTSLDAVSTTNFSSWTNADLASVTERFDGVSSQGAGFGFGIATGEKATAGAFGSTTATAAASADHAYIVVALKPPVASATSTVNVTWTDNSVIEDNFSLERKADAGSYSEIATPAANATSYEDTVDNGATYTYRIRSENANGFSSYSNEDSVVVPS